MGLFSKISEGLKKTRDSMMGKVEQVLNSFTKIDEDLFDELEEILISADVGTHTAAEICKRLRAAIKQRGVTDSSEVKALMKDIIAEMLQGDSGLDPVSYTHLDVYKRQKEQMKDLPEVPAEE